MIHNAVQAEYLPISQLHPFEGHPFQVWQDDEMDRLIWSIKTQGVLTPLVVRPREDGGYEVISGHRRLYACQKAGIETVPALIYTLDRDAAAIALVDSNLHREHILPSEKAFAYKLKMDAMRHQGTSGQLGQKWTRDELSSEESGRQVQRYIRLTNLIPGILSLVDEGRMALTPAVELSYLTPEQQEHLLDVMTQEDCTPSLSQAQQLKKLSQAKDLTAEQMETLLSEPKANQQEKLGFRMEEIRGYFPKNYTPAKMQETVMKLLEKYKQQWKRRVHDER